jgi:hypothetical protein
VLVGENLDFDMPRATQIFFQKDGGIAESRARFALSLFEQRFELRSILDDTHAAAAPTHGRFHDDGITNLLRDRVSLRR